MQHDNLGKFIRMKREALKPRVSLNKFAFENDIDPAMLSRIETGKQTISHPTIYKIAGGFNIRASQLLNEYELSDLFR